MFTGGAHVTITHDALDLTVQPLPTSNMNPEDPLTRTSLTSDIWLPSLETCSNMFIRPHCVGPPGSDWRSYRQRKRAVRVLLECFLVINEHITFKHT